MSRRWNRFFYHPCLPMGKNGTRITGSKEHIELSRAIASEGMVLLKNEDQTLPLKKGARIALFGKGSADYVKGGGGSGDVSCEYVRSLIDGLRVKQEEGKVTIFEKVSAFYEENVRRQYEDGAKPGLTVEPELPAELLSEARENSDTAIIVISRFSGEGWDRKTVLSDRYKLDPEEEAQVRLSASIFENGDFCLTEAEKKMAAAVMGAYGKVIVALNVGGVMETGWIRDDDRIRAALYMGQGGMEGGLAAADILVGDVNPSGRLTDTYPRTLEDFPSSEGFHESPDYAEYTEDIYVGYRYFETVPGVAEKVCYPFGYGLSYSDFMIRTLYCNYSKDEIVLSVRVMNLSQVPGKEVVQVYAKAPQGKLGKPALSLVSFAKTGLIGQGGETQLDMSFPVRLLASYDDEGKVQKSAWVLEKGDYEFYVGENVRSLEKVSFVWHVEEDTVLEQLSEKLKPHKLTKRMRPDGSYAAVAVDENPVRKVELTPDHDPYGETPMPLERQWDRVQAPDYWNPSKGGSVRLFETVDEDSLDDFMEQLSLDEMIHLLGGQPNRGPANDCGVGNIPRLGVPSVMTADGPQGLRFLPEVGIRTTAWPAASLLACTWDRTLTEKMGEAVAEEVIENNMGVWLAPAINIHRSPLCGRNFEYYSEDPVLTGVMAGGMVHGVQKKGVAVSLKHFSANNKETNRKYCDSRVSERALREIYLKAFELIVKMEQPWMLMSSYNLVNGVRCAESKELLTDILRDEWGYQGVVTTDWWAASEHYLEIRAGNDVKMPTGYPDRVKEAYEKGLISEEEIRTSARRVLQFILRLG